MAESVIIPVLPSPIDMRAASEFIKNVKKHSRIVNKKSKIALVANRGRDYTNIYWELDGFLESQKIPFLTMVRDSQNYIRAAEKGLGIFEMAPSMTDVDRTYFEPIIDWLNSKKSR
jgi:chromosome partitioning protein